MVEPVISETGTVGMGRIHEAGGRCVLDGAFAVLDALAVLGEAGLTAIARHSGMPKATVYRLLQQLVGLGAAEKTGSRYRIGARIFTLGRAWRPNPALHALAWGPMRHLTRVTGVTVGLGVLSQGQVTVAAAVQGESVRPLPSAPGTPWPLSTAMAKTLLAFTPEPGLLTPPAEVQRHQIRQVREAGIALDHEETMHEIWCVAVPVLDQAGAAVAAMCAVTSSPRRLRQLSDSLTGISTKINAALY